MIGMTSTYIVKTIGRHFQGVLWQRCQEHFVRNICSLVRKKNRSRVIEMVREITIAQTYITARKRMDEAIEGLEKSHPRVA